MINGVTRGRQEPPRLRSQACDTILWYARGADWAFYADAVRVHAEVALTCGWSDGVQEKTDRGPAESIASDRAGKVPEDWWFDVETLNQLRPRAYRLAVSEAERLSSGLLQRSTGRGHRVADWFSGWDDRSSRTTPSVEASCRSTASRPRSTWRRPAHRSRAAGCHRGVPPPDPRHPQQSSTVRRIWAQRLPLGIRQVRISAAQGD